MDISTAKTKAEMAALLHKATKGNDQGACFKYALKRAGKLVGDEESAFWEQQAARMGMPAAAEGSTGLGAGPGLMDES